jgi:hypothetical protein
VQILGGKKVKVAVGVDYQLENIFVMICKPVKYDYYTFVKE